MISAFKDQYRFLSNFYEKPLTYKGIIFPTAEHAFQAAKAKHYDELLWVAESRSPGEAKRRGRQVVLRPDWDSAKLVEMYNILTIKFSDPDLKVMLNNTKGQELVEGNFWHDQFWGDCWCSEHNNIPGKNYLGKTLMVVRGKPII